MRQIFKKSVILVSLAIIIVACSKSEKSLSEQLLALKAVNFAEQPEEIVFEKPTGRVIGGEMQYLQTVRKQKVLNPVEIIQPTNLDVIYPGSVLRGDSFMEGKYDPILIKNPKEIVLSTTLLGKDLNVKKTSKAIPSEVRQSVNDLLNRLEDKIDYDNTASDISYFSHEITTKESFNKCFGVHANVNVLSRIIDANFSYQESQLTGNSKKKILIKVRQLFYNVTVDPKSSDEWGDLVNIGDYEPIYISSVDYGRVVHIYVETNNSYENAIRVIETGIGLKFAKIGGGVSTEQKQELTKFFQENKVKIILSGGPLSMGKNVSDVDSLREFLEKPKAEDLVKSATPIGYKVRTLKDNKEVEVRVMYTEQRFKNKN